MKYIIFIIILTLTTVNLFSQTITVKDKTTSNPIANVEISNLDKSLQILTDNSGKADIKVFKTDDTLYFRYPGYPEMVLTFAEVNTNKTVLMDDEVVTYSSFVYSASKSPQNTKELSNRVLAISSEQARMQNPQTAADLLSAGGEVFVQKSQLGGGSPMIRGFATNRVLMAVDGVRMNNAIFRSGNIQNVISLDPLAIHSTEILFGPGSNIYGSDAIGGVMNFTTLRPRYANRNNVVFSGNVFSRYASANYEKTAHLDFNIGLKKWAFVSSFTVSDYDDLMMGSFGPEEYLRKRYVRRVNGVDSVFQNPNPKVQVPTGYRQFNFLQKVAYKISPKTEIVYALHVSETSEFSRYDRLTRPRNNTLRSAEWNYGPQKWMMNHLQLVNRKRTTMYNNLTLNLGLQNFEESRIDRDLNKTTRFITKEKVLATSFNLDLTKHLKKNRLYYGLEYVHNKVNSEGKEVNINSEQEKKGLSRYPDGSTWSSTAVYASYIHHFGNMFSVQAGGRFNQYTLQSEFDTSVYKFPFTEAKINKGALTGSIGLNFHPSKAWIITSNFSTGFRSPNVDDIGKIFESTPGSVIVPNPELEAEYAVNAEIGISKSIQEVFQIDANVFSTRLNNALVRRAFKFNGADSIDYKGTMSRVEAVQNAAFASVYGFQAGFKLNLPEGFGISSRITYTKGEEELDNGEKAPLRHAAPLFGVTHLTYNVNRLKADFYAMYNSAVSNKNLAPEEQAKDYMYAIDPDGKPFSPQWLTLNIKLMVQLNSYLSLTTGLENITDRRYRPYSSGVVAPGRNFIFALRGVF